MPVSLIMGGGVKGYDQGPFLNPLPAPHPPHRSSRAAMEKRRHVLVKSRSALGVIPNTGRSANLPRMPNKIVINDRRKKNQLTMFIIASTSPF